jgi:hypothetical protein
MQMLKNSGSAMGEKPVGQNIIARCAKGHFFVRNRKDCPLCQSPIQETFEYRQGDCVACGLLCPGYALGCSSPSPIDAEEVDEAERFIAERKR